MWMDLTVSNLNDSRNVNPSKHFINLEHITSTQLIPARDGINHRALDFFMTDAMQWRTEVETEIDAVMKWIGISLYVKAI